MVMFFKVFGYGLAVWVVLQPVKAIVRSMRRKRALAHLEERLPVEKCRVAKSYLSVGPTLGRRIPSTYFRTEADGFRVDLHPAMKPMTYPWTWTRLEVHLGYGLPPNLIVQSSEGIRGLHERLPGAKAISNDTEFDRLHALKGDQPELASYLTESRRRALTALIRRGGEVRGSALVITSKHLIFEGRKLESEIRELVSTARIIAVPADETSPIQGLVANAGSNDLVEVRLHNLRLLYQYYGQSAEAIAQTEQLLDDASHLIRLEAACHRPEGSESVLMEFLTGAYDLDTRVRAVRGMGGASAERVGATILELLSSTETEIRLASIHSAGLLNLRGAYEPMMKRFPLTQGPEREELAKALVRLSEPGDPTLEERLLETLQEPPICAPGPIIHGLATVGSVKAVEKLIKALAGAYGGGRNDRHAAKEAIRSIQSRAGNASPGQVSLAEAHATRGALSLEVEENGND